MHYGRNKRLAPPALRKALVARDGGCVVHGCDAPPQYTEAHHLTWWSRSGETNIDNLALVCGTHHTAIHDGTRAPAVTPSASCQWQALS